MKVVLLLWPFLAAGCISVIHPPLEPPEDPVTVYLLERAKHRGIVLPHPDGDYVEYGYGEWGWYAENKDRWYNVFDTLFWPTRGALGRRRASGATQEELEGALDARLQPVIVSGARAAALRAALEAAFDRAARDEPEGLVYNPSQRMHFVRHRRRFWLFWNCADETAEWFRTLGCRVSRAVVRLGIVVAIP